MSAGDLSQLNPIISQLQPYLSHYGYWAVFGGVLLESFGVPLPGETLLITGVLLAAQGRLDPVRLLLMGACGAVLGDNIGYAVGHFFGRRWAVRYGRYIWLNEQRLHRLEGAFERHGPKIILVARFFEGLRQFNGFIAGTLKLGWMRFLKFNMLGAVLWVSLWGGTAYYLGDRLMGFFRRYQHLEIVILTGAAAVAVLTVIWGIKRGRGEK